MCDKGAGSFIVNSFGLVTRQIDFYSSLQSDQRLCKSLPAEFDI